MGAIAGFSALGAVAGVAMLMFGRGHPASTGFGAMMAAVSVVCLVVSGLSLVFG